MKEMATKVVEDASTSRTIVEDESASSSITNDVPVQDKSHWSNIKPPETKTRDEEMEEYLQDLLL